MRIIGLDVGKNSVVACVLEKQPEDLKTYLRQSKEFMEFKATVEGIKNLLEIPFDIAIIEPTGIHYSKLWGETIEANGREVRWISHQAVANHRKSNRLPNKNDKADALAMADYGLAHKDKRDFFIWEPFNPLREKYLQLQSITRARSPIINRLRQQLAHEWPEKQGYSSGRKWDKKTVPPFWRYLAEESIRKREGTIYDQESAESIGNGISNFSRGLAIQICGLERMEIKVEEEIEPILKEEKYLSYIKVFNELDFNKKMQACILSRVYPIEKFLSEEKKVKQDHVRTASGKRSRRNRSKAAFKLSLGCGMVEYQSGDKTVWKAGGPKQVRVEWWRWIKSSMIMNPPSKPLTIELYDRYRKAKDAGVKDKIAMSRTYNRAASMLFDLLLKEIV